MTRGIGRCRGGLVAVAMVAVMAPHVGAQTLRDTIAMTMRIPEDAVVQRYAEYYAAARQRPWLRKVMQRVGFYGGHILDRVDDRNLPPELIFLPVIESGYESTATSPAGAMGLWQLMGRTAREHGLATGGEVDERRDFWKATEVALGILQANYDELGSWELALAAYNAGTGRVRTAVRRSGTRDFWELRELGYLPRETREYVPRYYGLLRALRSLPEKEWPGLEGQPRWRRMAVAEGVELRRLGELAGVPEGVLEWANAELGDGLTPAMGDREGYLIKVPDRYYDRIGAVLSLNSPVSARALVSESGRYSRIDIFQLANLDDHNAGVIDSPQEVQLPPSGDATSIRSIIAPRVYTSGLY